MKKTLKPILLILFFLLNPGLWDDIEARGKVDDELEGRVRANTDAFHKQFTAEAAG